jgi:NTP pyrophosphatase (non-canonical NTP hydrolase)
LRAANEVRQREWDVLGQLTLAYRGNELAGEVGEACNVIKKLERERLGINGSRDTVEHLAEELADVIICTDLIAMQAGIDLEGAVVAKFNASSEKVGLKTRMVRRQSPAVTADEASDLVKLAAECHRAKWVFQVDEEAPPRAHEARQLVVKAFDELHRIGDMAREMYDKARRRSQPETDAEVFMASNAALTSEVLQLRAQVERLTAALTEIEDLGVDGATGARLANIATQALSPLPFEPKKERKPKLSPQDGR